MRKIYISIMFCVCLLFTQAQTWQWAYDGGNSPNAMAGNIYTGNNGDMFFALGYINSIKIDSFLFFGPAWGSYLVCKVSGDAHLYSAATLYSANQQGSLGLSGLSFTKTGQLYASGSFLGTASVDTITISGSGGFITQFNENANAIWYKNVMDDAYGADNDEDGNIFINGRIYGAVTNIDTFLLYNNDSLPQYNPKMVLAKLDSAARCQWVIQGNRRSSYISKLATHNNNVYILGTVDTCDLLDTISICNGSGSSSFLIKLSNAGAPIWKIFPANPEKVKFRWFDTDSSGNCFVLGDFSDTLNLGTGIYIPNPGSLRNTFLAKYSAAGNIEWVAPIYSDSLVFINAIHTNKSGETYIAAGFDINAVIGTDNFTGSAPVNSLIARYSSNGTYLGAAQLANAQISSITEDSAGNAVVIGNIGPGIVSSYFGDRELKSTAQYNFFIAKLSAITTGLSRIFDDDHLVIYANPNTGSFNITLPDAMAYTRRGLLTIYNSNGLTIKNEWVDISNHALQVDLGPVTRGIYTVTLTGNQRRFTGKVVVQ